jgi:hypothetical protein
MVYDKEGVIICTPFVLLNTLVALLQDILKEYHHDTLMYRLCDALYLRVCRTLVIIVFHVSLG